MVEPEEAAALAATMNTEEEGAGSRVSVVVPRDFTEPRTLSADRINRIHKTLSARLQAMANLLAGPLRGHPTLSVGEVSEVNAQGLFDDLNSPFLVHGFEAADQLGWVMWTPEAARLASDLILSGPKDPLPPAGEGEAPPEPEEEPALNPILSKTERRVIARLLDQVVGLVVAEFGLTMEPGAIWQEPEELTSLEDLGPDADSRRLFIHLSFEDAAGNASDIRIYIPGIPGDETSDAGTEHSTAPQHLAPVHMSVDAVLGGTFVPLTELLGVEVGDVIPLDARLGDPIRFEVEETTCAQGRFGAHDGLLAIRLDEVGATLPPHPPTD
ncbi:MAG: FliM/FliN family flagellar motor C-terminal domain-containing protein [Planctomycetota bacterium]|nr:FliM/FliN family flagellar motor C-terminal domain-containing protein [Planctomycetota bacterium]